MEPCIEPRTGTDIEEHEVVLISKEFFDHWKLWWPFDRRPAPRSNNRPCL